MSGLFVLAASLIAKNTTCKTPNKNRLPLFPLFLTRDTAQSTPRRSGKNFISIRPEASRIAVRDVMNLNETQQQTVTGWVAAGMKLSEVQNRLGTELGVRLTYMEVRLLVDDLKLKLKDPEVPHPPAPAPAPGLAAAQNPPLAPPITPATPPLPGSPTGNVSLSMDHLARPGTLVSGKVTFSDGITADWHLDQSGRLGVVPPQPGYKPSAADVQQFQMELEREMSKMGL